MSTSSNNSFKRRSGILPKRVTPRNRPSWLKDTKPIQIDDDDDDVIEIKKPLEFDFKRKPSFKNTSTPNYSNTNKVTQNGDDEVTFIKECSPIDERKTIVNKKRGLDYSKPLFSFQNGNSSQSTNNRLTNGTKKKDTNVVVNTAKDASGKFSQQSKKISNQPISTADYSFRLDDKRIYKELLSKAAPTASMKSFLDSFTEYCTPVGKIGPSFRIGSSRSKRMLDMALKSNDRKIEEFIDLTNTKEKANGFSDSTANDKDKPRRSATSDKIKKVLNEMDNEVVVKDSDSEVEILPAPPSPKSDFNVGKCNSLKTFVHPSQPTHDNWIKNE